MTKNLIAGQMAFALRDTPDEIMLLDLPTEQFSNVARTGGYTGFSAPSDFSGIAISPEGKYVMVGVSASPYVLTYNRETDAVENPFPAALTTEPNSIQFSPAGNFVALGYEASPYVEVYSYPGFVNQGVFTDLPISKLNDLKWTPDGTKLVGVSDDSPFIHVWDAATRASVAPTFASPPTADCDFLSCTNTMVMVSGADTGANKRAYDLITGANLVTDTFDGFASAFTPDGSFCYVVHSSTSDAVRKFNTSDWSFVDLSFADSTEMARLFNNPAKSRDLYALDNDHLIFHFENGTILFNATTETSIYWIKNLIADVGRLALHPDTEIGFIAGTVDDGALGSLSRDVIAVDRASGVVVGRAISSAVNGAYKIVTLSRAECAVLSIGQGSELTQIVDRVVPQATDPDAAP